MAAALPAEEPSARRATARSGPSNGPALYRERTALGVVYVSDDNTPVQRTTLSNTVEGFYGMVMEAMIFIDFHSTSRFTKSYAFSRSKTIIATSTGSFLPLFSFRLVWSVARNRVRLS